MRNPDWHWAEKFDWKQVAKYIWQREDGKFHFENECSQFDETPHDTLEQCEEALAKYVP